MVSLKLVDRKTVRFRSVNDVKYYCPNSDYVDKRILNRLRTNQRATKIRNEVEQRNPSNQLAITTAFLPFKYRVNTRKYSYRYEKERYIRIRSIYESIYWITSMRRWFMCETRAKYSMNWESKAEFVPPRLYTLERGEQISAIIEPLEICRPSICNGQGPFV